MNRKSAFLSIVVRQAKRAGHHHISRLPPYPTLPPSIRGRRRPAIGNIPAKPKQPSIVAAHSRDSARSNLRLAAGRAAIVLFTLLLISRAFGGVREIGEIGLTVGDLSRELTFYTNTLPFKLVSISETSGPALEQLLNVPGVHIRLATLRLGDERITLTEHIGMQGKPIPADSRSFDHWFQHIAIVVSDMDRAYETLCAHHVKHVSTAPQTLPAWNTNAAGIRAFYFLDPENHVLEIIQFPRGKGNPKWQAASGPHIFLGIDHTAIVISDTDASLEFYRDLLGLRIAGASENHGVEQEHLNQVFGARLRITSLRATSGPGIELLEYITPPGGRSLPSEASSSDFAFWSTHLVVDDVTGIANTLRTSGIRFISNPSAPSQLVRDPDGHALEFDKRPSEIETSSKQ